MGQTRITIRPLRLSDTGDIYEIMHMPNVLWGTAQLPSKGLETWRKTIERWLDDEHMHVFVAEVSDKVVGSIHLRVGKGRESHVGTISMAVHDKYQGQSIGKMLMFTIIDLADNWLNLLRLQLEVYTDNERAVNLYKRFDFEIEGQKRCDGFRAGAYLDSYVMGRLRPQLQLQNSADALTSSAHSPRTPEPDLTQ
jgi:L-phenylalanine/L-methionine N-acetyltransferase